VTHAALDKGIAVGEEINGEHFGGGAFGLAFDGAIRPVVHRDGVVIVVAYRGEILAIPRESKLRHSPSVEPREYTAGLHRVSLPYYYRRDLPNLLVVWLVVVGCWERVGVERECGECGVEVSGWRV
jgi:hypothetical protein